MIDHIDHRLRNALTAALGAALHEASQADYALKGIDILGERLGAALRRGWDSAAPDRSPAPVEPATHAATRALVDRLTAQLDEARARIAELKAELAGMRVERIGSAGECVTGDGVRWSVVPGRGPTRADYVFVTVGITEDGDDSNVAGIPVASLLRACGRGDL